MGSAARIVLLLHPYFVCVTQLGEHPREILRVPFGPEGTEHRETNRLEGGMLTP